MGRSSAKRSGDLDRIDQRDCLSSWRSRKPSLRKNPFMWAKRKFRIKLGDMLRPLGMRVTEEVDFSSLRRDIEAAHVLDVGVADGTPSLYARFPDAKLDLFEPAKAHVPIIEQGIVATRNARLHCVALAENNGFGVLSRPGSSSATLLPAVHQGSINPTCDPVPVRRLDGLLTSGEIERPCLLKIDTEGTELSVLKGATGIINDIDTIVVEIHFRRRNTHQPHQVLEFLSTHGFVLTDMLEREVIEGSVACADFVFERR